ncbi:MAG: Type 1 glutamine amidotransferase-like domain-containing protein [Candidatus Nanopelagicales bacterium]
MKQNILASGGNEFSQEYAEADLAALKNSEELSELLIVVTAPYPTQELAYRHAEKYFASLEIKTKMSGLLDKKDATKRELVSEIENAKAIYIAGGTPSRLVDAFIDTPAGEGLLSAVENQAVVMGSSAGAMLMSKRVVMPTGQDLGEGLNLLGEAIVLPHFSGVIPSWVQQYKDSGIKFFGLTEGSSILTSSTDATLLTEFGSVTII